MKEGLKYDEGKARWDLLPIEPIEEIVKVLTFGSIKYDDNSWQKLENGKERYFAALMRHIAAWKKGEKKAKDSGIHHLAHAACNLVFLLWLEKEYENIVIPSIHDEEMIADKKTCGACGGSGELLVMPREDEK